MNAKLAQIIETQKAVECDLAQLIESGASLHTVRHDAQKIVRVLSDYLHVRIRDAAPVAQPAAGPAPDAANDAGASNESNPANS